VGYPKDEESCDPDRMDERSDEGFGELLRNKLLNRFPTLGKATIVHGWSGMYTITPDWHPIVGKEPGVEGYYLGWAAAATRLRSDRRSASPLPR
jgi:glycine/D-amino acid oxidase-like deaminating enzyme